MTWFLNRLSRRRKIKNLLNDFVELFQKSGEFQQGLANYQRALNSKEWQFHRDLLLTIKGKMATNMFERNYTELSPEEKDVIQRTYYHISQMLDFLSNPLGWMKKKSKWSDLIHGKVKPSQNQKEKKQW